MDAQDRALAFLAIQRGLVDPAALRAVFTRLQGAPGPLPQVAVREGLLQAGVVATLLRDLSRATFVCAPCRRELSYDQLAGRERMVCERCAGPLTCTPPPPTGSSGFAKPVRPSGQVPLPPPLRLAGSDDLDRYVSEDLTEEDATEPPQQRSDSSWGSAILPPVPPSSASATKGPERANPEGRRFGPYVIERELGRGSNGVVYLARRPGIDAPLALKVLRDADLADEETIKRFELEAAVAQKLRDPGIIAVFDVGKEGEARYFVMEYCAGKTLKERIQEGRVPPDEAAALILAIARAMSVAHDAGVIHRDLKPANVIIDAESGQPRVTDFGLARDRSLLQSMTRTGDIIGTPFYMAPEQLKGEKALDHRIDIYALGVLLFECLTGTRPFKADTFIQLVEAATKTDVTPPGVLVPGTPRGLDAIVLKAMARDPRARYRSCHELVDDLERVQRRQLPKAPLPPRRKGDAPDRRVQVGVGIAAAVLVALGIGVAVALRGDSNTVAPPPSTETAVAPELDVRVLRRRFEELTRARRRPAELRAGLEELLLVARDSQLRGLIEAELRRVRTREAIERLAGAAEADVAKALNEARAAAGDDLALAREIDLAQGERLILRGRFTDALAALDAATVDHGAIGRDAQRARGFVFEKLGRRADAIKSYTAAEDDTARGYCARAALKRLDGELPGADLNAQSALRIDPDHVTALLELARCRLERGDEAGADAPIERARSLAPTNPEVHVLGAILKLREDKPESATDAVERAMALTPGSPDPDALVVRAQAAFESRPPRTDVAMTDLEEALRRAPEHLEALLWRGVVRHGRSDRDGAVEDWRHAWAVDRQRCERLVDLLPRESVESFRRAVGLKPTDGAPTPAGSPLAGVDQAEVQAAAEALLGAFTSSADTPLKDKLSPALTTALTARVADAEQSVRDDLLKGLVLAARGRPWGEVALPLKRGARFAEGASAVIAQLELARLLVARDRTAEAQDAIAEARRVGVATHELARLEAEAAWRAGRLDEALTHYRALAAADPDGAEGRCAAAMALIIDGSPEDARAAAERALSVDATHAASHVTRAIALARQGQPELSQKALEAAYAREGATSSALGAVWFLNSVRHLLATPGYPEALPDHALLRVYDSAFARLLAVECLLARRRNEKGELALASALLDRALALEPDRAHAHLVAGRLGLLTGAPQQDVLAKWRRARELSPGLPLPASDALRFRERFDADAEALLRR